jgi:hypothetical protein
MVKSIKPGTSSNQVLAMQKYLNKGFGYHLEESGNYDDETLKAVQQLQSQMGMGMKNGVVDEQMMIAMREALVPRTWVTVNGKTALITKEQFATLRAAAIKRAVAGVEPLVSMATEAQGYWKAHDQAHKKHWFWSKLVDAAVGTTLPPGATMQGAVATAQGLMTAAQAGTLTTAQLNAGSAKIGQAFADMEQYRSEMFGGGEQLVANLEKIRTGAAVGVTILAAVVTAGASLKVQVGVMAAAGAYDQVLKEIDTASKQTKPNVEQAVKNVLVAAAVEAAIQLLFKGNKLGDTMDDIAKAAAKNADKVIVDYALRVANGGTQEMIKEAMRMAKDFANPNSVIDYKALVDRLGVAFATGAGLKVIGPTVKEYGTDASKRWTQKDFQGLGSVKLDKAGEEAVKQTIKTMGTNVVTVVLAKWKYDSAHDKFEREAKKEMMCRPEVKKTYDQQAKKAKK